MSEPIEPEQLSAIHQFAGSAEEYCTLMENHQALTDEVLVERCAAALAAIYRDLLALPHLNDEDVDWNWEGAHADREVDFSDQHWGKSLYERFDARQHDLYWLYFDPFDATSNLSFPLYMTLWEIYEDMRRGLAFYRQGTDRAFIYASRQWRGKALVHWGQHVTDALRVLHEIIVIDWNNQPRPDDDEDDDE